MSGSRRALVGAIAAFATLAASLAAASPASAATPNTAGVVINEVYGGGGNSGATFTNDFIELFNSTDAPVDLTGWSVQYASTAGTWANGSQTNLAGSIPAHGYYLVQEAAGSGGTMALPTPDAAGTIAMSGTGAKVALVQGTTRLTCTGTACAADATLIDLVGWGAATTFLGTVAPATANATSASRNADHANTWDNGADFAAGEPTPQNSASVPPVSAPDHVVISEVYGAGGFAANSTLPESTWKNDFVELFNPTSAAVTLDGWSVAYGSAGRASGGNLSNKVNLSGSIAAGGYYLIAAAGGDFGADLPTPDLTASGISMASGSGFVVLSNGTATLALPTGDIAGAPGVVDAVGYGTANTFEGAPQGTALSGTFSAQRGAADTDDNSADFTVGTPAPVAGETEEPEDPGDPGTTATIAEIQGTGSASPLVGTTVTTRGVVTARYPTGGLNGYVLQTPGPDATPGASDAVFVFSSATVASVAIGDYVEVTGAVSEFFGLTELSVSAGNATVLSDPHPAVVPHTGAWPATDAEREALESALYQPSGAFTVSNTYTTNQYGEVGLAAGTLPLIQPTDAAPAGSAAAAAVAADNAARAVTLDDGASTNFLSSANSALTPPYISLAQPLRVGAAVTFSEPVVIDFRNDVWKLNPTAPVVAGVASPVSFGDTRTAAPEPVGGDLSIATFNVLNYFTTLGEDVAGCSSYNDRAGDPVTTNTCPGNGPRGAYEPEDLARQQAKIVAAINAIGADVVGLLEIENSAVVDGDPDEALATLVAALNAAAGAGTWAYVPSSAELPPTAEMDVITNAIIYRPAAVERVGASRALGTESAAGGAFDNAREPIAQEFAPVGGGEPFLFVINHFKSKGSAGPWPGDADAGDGQGASNESRVRQATALRDWVATIADPDEAVALGGDFNSYTQEDPLQVLYSAGYADAASTLATDQFSYSFDGLSGSLDHLLLNEAALERATGADIWEINAEEALALEYSRYNYHGTLFYAPDAYRSSDHDPVIVGLERGEVAPAYPAWGSGTVYTGGQYVTYNGKVYYAQWWTSGEVPGSSPWGAWAEVGAPVTCASGSYLSWTPSWTYTGGETVVYGGHRYRAQWWTRNQVPTTPWGPWLDLGTC